MCYSNHCYKNGIGQKNVNIHENPYFPEVWLGKDAERNNSPKEGTIAPYRSSQEL